MSIETVTLTVEGSHTQGTDADREDDCEEGKGEDDVSTLATLPPMLSGRRSARPVLLRVRSKSLSILR